MTAENPAGPHAPAALLDDWITIWQSELAALATDRELQEAAQRTIDAWAAQARVAAILLATSLDPPGPAGPPSPPGAPPSAPAPDARDALIRSLESRVADLERRLP